MAKYFFRLDDIAPNMNWDNFYWLRELFNQYDVRPLAAIIPDNQDENLLKYSASPNFWGIINELVHNGWVLGQHGYQHLRRTENGGILAIHKRSEFASMDFQNQNYMISAGKQILKEKTEDIDIFVAPWHSFDKNTLLALKQNGFRYISDGIGLYPFKKKGLVWLPQIAWNPRNVPFGMVTFALHLNTMTSADLQKLQQFIEENKNQIGDFSDLVNWHNRVGFLEKILTFSVNQLFKILWKPAYFIKHVSK